MLHKQRLYLCFSFGFVLAIGMGSATLLPVGGVRAEEDACPDIP